MIFTNTGAILHGKKTEEWLRLSKGYSLHMFLGKFYKLDKKNKTNGVEENLLTIHRRYAVQDTKRREALAHVILKSLHRQDVRTLTDKDVVGASFPSHYDFMLWWLAQHDEGLLGPYALLGLDALQSRPAYLYDGIRLKFELEDSHE